MTNLDKLKAELDRLHKRAQKRRAEQEADQKRERVIKTAIDRNKVAELLNVPDGVTVRYRQSSGRAAGLNDATGTVLEVRRTRCTVLFGDTKWSFPMENLLPATEKALQGFYL